VELSPIVLIAGAVLVAVVLGPWLTRVAARLAARDDTAGAAPVRTAVVTLLLVLLLAGAAALVGARDLASHRLPDRVTYPAAVVCAAALTADAAALGSWDALVRALLAAGASGGVAALAWLVVPAGLGLGDVKLLALLGLVLGWVGWGVLLAGIFLGLVVGSLVSVVLLLTRRAGWRTALPFGPPLLTGAVLALAVQGPASLG
jgi:leader peptidase (prepilin peptidase)/N-methyltransferase